MKCSLQPTPQSRDMLHCLNGNDCKTLFKGCCSVTCFVMVCPFCCQTGSLTVVLSTGFAIFLHSCFKYYLHFFVGISLRALRGFFKCSDVKCCFSNGLSIMVWYFDILCTYMFYWTYNHVYCWFQVCCLPLTNKC